jgi:hypothetical protein
MFEPSASSAAPADAVLERHRVAAACVLRGFRIQERFWLLLPRMAKVTARRGISGKQKIFSHFCKSSFNLRHKRQTCMFRRLVPALLFYTSYALRRDYKPFQIRD